MKFSLAASLLLALAPAATAQKKVDFKIATGQTSQPLR